MFDKYKDKVLHLVVRKENGDEANGTAFVIAEGTIATAAHNLKGNVYITPWFEHEPVPKSAMVIHEQEGSGADVAIIRVPDLHIDSEFDVRREPVQPGEEIAAMGYPSVPLRQASLQIMTGHVEGITPTYGGDIRTVSVSIQISGGMSGGPVLDRRGSLIGIVIERTYASVQKGIPERPFNHILPVEYLRQLQHTE